MNSFLEKLSSLQKTILLGLIHISIIYAHSLTIAIGETRKACAEGVALYDVVHDWAANGIRPFVWFSSIPHNYIILVLSVILIGFIIFDSKRWVYLRRFFLFHSLLSIIRAVSIWVTTIPSPDPECFSRLLAPDDIYARAISLSLGALGVPWDTFKIGIPGNTCCDCIISGHTATLMVLGFLLTKVIKQHWLKRIIWSVVCVGLLGLMVPPWHYSVDVIVTAIISYFMMKYYFVSVHYSSSKIVRFIEQDS